ncbi:MAG: acyl-CoA/acyl-ACP dehydrogenase [Gammaproteobacteria bacterium]|nr:acyl-CoA/acyl-ACP dehydrogenase [Gammaproteobacteria bacterium]
MATSGHHSSEYQDFDQLLKRVHQIGKDVVLPAAEDVDKHARFPREAIDALKEAKLLSAYVPVEFGGMGLNIAQIAKICEVLGQYCGSSAMVYAMHKIQVACIVHHGTSSPYFRNYLHDLVNQQRLIASATTEIGVGGDLRSSVCAVEVTGNTFKLTKKAPVISYGVDADDIMVTSRRSEQSPASDQVHVLVKKQNYHLEPISGWDTLGFRGTCSSGFVLSSSGSTEQILPVPFADILSQTMHPYAHIVWSSLWSGIAADAVNLARAFVREQARKNPSAPPTSALRLAETDSVLQTMRNNVRAAVVEYDQLLRDGNPDAFNNFGFTIRTNNLKLSCSQLIVDIVGRAMLICGISSYRNDSKFSLSRQIRDAYGAALMVNNDRIMNHNATMLMVHKEG